jgi:hypothetical protein
MIVNTVNRAQATNLLRELASTNEFRPNWISLINRKKESYEVHIKLMDGNVEALNSLLQKYGLAMKQDGETTIIYAPQNNL